MTEPMSFVASVVAVSQLAGTVASKGYRYLKAVKDCPEDVRRLVAETNILCGILTRLALLLPGTESKPDNCNREAAVIDSSSETDDDQAEACDQPLGTPDFIHECQKTLEEIQSILHGFRQPRTRSTQSSQHTGKRSRYSLSALRNLEPRDLKWPLSKSRTLQLIENLERHKSTCTIALARDGLHGIHRVLEQTKLSNKHLAELRAKQSTILKLQLNEEEKKALAWLSPVNPTLKHQAFKRDRYPGTGTWLFDLPEMTNWLDSPNDALWIYGIPGAGKTTLSTLVVDEVLNRNRSECIGTAYFYIRHDDKDSHKLANVIGSLISQLACQNTDALTDLRNWYAEHASQGPHVTAPDDQDLIEKLQHISAYFEQTYIMIDGLDECGCLFDLSRESLIDAVAGISGKGGGPIRTLVFSRDAQDIRTRLSQMNFHPVSIAASSADLRLFTNSWLAKLDIRSESLKIDIVETLVHEAEGMFMWVRAQIDYLRRLTTDREKRNALKELPPDLPETYVRIFESINATFPKKTTGYIQRLLRWLVLCKDESVIPRVYQTEATALMSSDRLRQAICIENDHDWPTDEEIPTLDRIQHWLGCLIRVTERHDEIIIELSHFTVREFLTVSSDNVSSPVVHQYLVDRLNDAYYADVCMIYLTHSHFRNIEFSTSDEIKTFLLNHPLYRYVAIKVLDHLSFSCNSDIEPHRALQRFFSIPPSKEFMLWQKCSIWLDLATLNRTNDFEINTSPREFLSPLHFAAIAGLKKQIKQILADNVDPNVPADATNLDVAPLHVALAGGNDGGFVFRDGHLEVVFDLTWCADCPESLERSLEVTSLLINSGANINQQLVIHHFQSGKDLIVTPLVLSLLCLNWRVASFLLDVGAKWDAISEIDLDENTDVCSVKNLLEVLPEWEGMVERLVEFKGHTGVKDTLEHWRRSRDGNDSSRLLVVDHNDQINFCTDPQEAFINAISDEKWQEVRELLANHSGIDVNCFNKEGDSAIYCAAKGDKDTLLRLLERGAHPNLHTKDLRSALNISAYSGLVENLKILLELGADIEHIDPGGYTPLLQAVHKGHLEALQLLIDAGANLNAVLIDGSSALLVAIEHENVPACSALLLAGVNPTLPDNYGNSPLYAACGRGLEDLVRTLLALPSILADSLDAENIYLLNPLYVAAEEGFDRIVKILLDHGAEINQGRSIGLGSPLLTACAHNHSAVVRLLLARGAYLEVEGSQFGSALGTARAWRNEGILNILEAHEINPLQEEENESVNGDSPESSGDVNECGGTHTAHDQENGEETSKTEEIAETAVSASSLEEDKPRATGKQ